MSEAPGNSNNTNSPSSDEGPRIPVEDERTSDNVKKCPQKKRNVRRSRPDDESLERVKERGGNLVLEFDGEPNGYHLQPSNDPPAPNNDVRVLKGNENENEHSNQNVPNQESSDEEECQGAQSIAPRHEDLHNLPGPSNAASRRKSRKREVTPSKSCEDLSESDTGPKQLPSPRKKSRASIPKVPSPVGEVDSSSPSPSNPTNGSDPASEDESKSNNGSNSVSEDESKSNNGSNPVSEDDSKSIDGSNPVSEDDSKSIDGSNPVSEDDSNSNNGSISPVSESNLNSSRPAVPPTPRKKY
ncbi:transcription factor mef2A-like [Trichogramma pretiosum]|uniref:transcription factor mef2A-like n=1 Tax=Trichogramma pretiosum TaxID=7493 RepID=UPI000C71968F|nr:transcription factor mef2A-like [Trichogramma pretiosum]